MSKAFRGKPCVYCGAAGSSSAPDHVIARGFILPSERANLPKVPSCQTCNAKKASLEHYLTAILPFGGQHSASAQTLSEMVPPRLANNVALHQSLRSGMQEQVGQSWTGLPIPEMSLPLDGDKLSSLLGYIAQGLSFWHWKVILAPEICDIQCGFLLPDGQSIIENLISMNGNRVKGSFGSGAFSYEGLQMFTNDKITLWRMSFYGAIMGEQRLSSRERVGYGYVSTAPIGKALPIGS